MSENTSPQHGLGKTGGLPGANADPQASEESEDVLREVQAGEVAQDPGSPRDA